MGFFKDLKQDLSQAVNELTEDVLRLHRMSQEVYKRQYRMTMLW